jgi:hypothetical protein
VPRAVALLADGRTNREIGAALYGRVVGSSTGDVPRSVTAQVGEAVAPNGADSGAFAGGAPR